MDWLVPPRRHSSSDVSRRRIRAACSRLAAASHRHRWLQHRQELLWHQQRVRSTGLLNPFCRSVSCAGLLSVVRWLLLRDFECVIFLPVVYNNPQNANSSHVHLLSKLEEIGLVTFTPARASCGDRKAFINYDDLYLTTMAERHGGCVLSGDRFKDILAHPNYTEFRTVIEERVVDIRFLFLNHDVVHFGDDIFFRAAPELFIMEDISTRAHAIAKKIYCGPEDPSFPKVTTRRQQFTPAKRREFLDACDDLIYELCEREGIRPLRLSSLPALQRKPEKIRISEPIPTLETLQLVKDESVWQPGDLVKMGNNREAFEETFEDCIQAMDDEMPLIDFSDDPASTWLPPCNIRSATDPFDLIDRQIAQYELQNGEWNIPEEEEIVGRNILEENCEEEEELVEHFNADNVAEESPLQPSGDSSSSTVPSDEERKNVRDQLCKIFPNDVVDSVLAMNVSCNVDFLAEQCLQFGF